MITSTTIQIGVLPSFRDRVNLNGFGKLKKKECADTLMLLPPGKGCTFKQLSFTGT